MHQIGKFFEVASSAREEGLAAAAVHALRQEKCPTVLAVTYVNSKRCAGAAAIRARS
jgi:hypothetical protein